MSDLQEDDPEYWHPCCVKERESAERKKATLERLAPHDRASRAVALRKASRPSARLAQPDDLQVLRTLLLGSEGAPGAPEGSGSGEEEAGADEDDGDGSDSDLDAELDALEAEMEALGVQDPRQAELKGRSEALEELREHGIGVHAAYSDGPRLMEMIGSTEALVLHLTPSAGGAASAFVDVGLEELAPLFLGTRSCRIDLSHPFAKTALLTAGAPASPLLRDGREAFQAGGALLCFSRGRCVSLEEDCAAIFRRGGVDLHAAMNRGMLEHITGALRAHLDKADVLRAVDPAALPALLDAARRSVPKLSQLGGGPVAAAEEEEEEEDSDWYDCGMEGCRKPFSHHHIASGKDVPLEFRMDTPGAFAK